MSWIPIDYSGPEGPTGPTGSEGPAGTSINLKGEVSTESALPTTGNQINDGWITTDTGNLWIWTSDLAWANVGKIVGPEGPTGLEGPTGPEGPPGPPGVPSSVYQATYYKSANQSLSDPNTDITFNVDASWNNSGGYITHASGSKDFVVVQSGLYQLEWNATILANGATWNNANSKTISIDITRSPTAEQVTIAQTATTATTLNYSQSLSSSFYLVAGDVINCRINGTFATQTPSAAGISNTFDLGTWFTWHFISLGSASAYQNPPPIIQAAGTTALIPTSANTTYILTSGNIENFTTTGLGAGNAGLVWFVKNARGVGGDITIQANGVNITGITSTLHSETGSANSSIQILYWNGTALSMY